MKAGAKASSFGGRNLESEYLAAGFSYPAMTGSRENFIAIMKTDISAAAFDKMNRKTKPPGSLGVLETVAVRLADLKQTLEPQLAKKRICVFAGSHGIASEDVSA